MTSRERHVLSTIPVAVVAVLLGHHPLLVLALVAGVLLPEVDATEEGYHRSWLLHTWLAPALVYRGLTAAGVADGAPWLVTAIHFVSLGMLLHFLADFVYPREMTHQGAEWPVRPTGFSAPWGLIWLGAAWTIQWFLYLAPAFLPWLFGV